MKITPLDNLTRFLVRSDVNPDNEYLVDLDQYGGIGFCACDHFKFRLEPELCKIGGVALAKKTPEAHRCKHIKAARETLGKELVNKLTQINNNQQKAHRTR